MRAATALVVFVASLLAGCLSSGPPAPPVDLGSDVPPDWAARAVPFELHDHYDPAAHQGLSTANFREVGWDPLLSSHYGRTAGGHLCGHAVDAGERRLGVVHGLGTDVAFVLVDLTDPAAPVPLGEFVLPRSSSRDVALTPDGDHVVIALSTPDPQDANRRALPTPSAGPASALWRSPCGEVPVRDLRDPLAPLGAGPEQDAPFPPGVMMVDISDPAAPAITDVYPLPGLGAHSIYAGALPGRTVVIASVTNLAAPASNFYFLDVEDTPAGARLAPTGVYQENPGTGGAPLINGHNDGVVQVHPVTKQPLAYLANWDQGMAIVDVSTPGVLLPVGTWSDEPGPGTEIQRDGVGSVHEAIPINSTWDGRHYTIIGQEILDRPSRTPSGWVKVLDTTDPTRPFEVAEWTLPVDVEWDEPLVFSSHYVDLHEKTLFVAHYHAGVWAVDLSCLPDCRHPPAVGVFVPANVSPEPPADLSYDWTPTVMDINVLPGGDVVVWDATSGVYVARFDAARPAPPTVYSGYE